MCCILNGVSFLLIEELDFFWRLFSLEPIILDDVDLMHNFQNFDPRRLDRSSGTWDDVNRIVATAEVRWRGRSTHLCIVNIFLLFLCFSFERISSRKIRKSLVFHWEAFVFLEATSLPIEVGNFHKFVCVGARSRKIREFLTLWENVRSLTRSCSLDKDIEVKSFREIAEFEQQLEGCVVTENLLIIREWLNNWEISNIKISAQLEIYQH